MGLGVGRLRCRGNDALPESAGGRYGDVIPLLGRAP
jgi:hypothetical protein